MPNWNQIGNIRGPQGNPGAKGDTGDVGPRGDSGTAGLAGPAGKSIHPTSGQPEANFGNVGDLALDPATGDVYQAT